MLGYKNKNENEGAFCLGATGTFMFHLFFLLYLIITIDLHMMDPMSSMGILGTSVAGTVIMLWLVLCGVVGWALGSNLVRLCKCGKESVSEKSGVEKDGRMNW